MTNCDHLRRRYRDRLNLSITVVPLNHRIQSGSIFNVCARKTGLRKNFGDDENECTVNETATEDAKVSNCARNDATTTIEYDSLFCDAREKNNWLKKKLRYRRRIRYGPREHTHIGAERTEEVRC